MTILSIIVACFITAIAAGFIAAIAARRNIDIKLKREIFIQHYEFSPEIFSKTKERYPKLKTKDLQLISMALRQYFLIHLRATKKTIEMPSRVVDIMWHEFILDTKQYTAFCKKAFGGYFHHIPPALNAQKATIIAGGLELVWWQAFREESIDPNNPERLPLLFAIDEKLKIADGNVYELPKYTQATSSSSSGSPVADAGGAAGCGGASAGCGGASAGCGGCGGCGGC